MKTTTMTNIQHLSRDEKLDAYESGLISALDYSEEPNEPYTSHSEPRMLSQADAEKLRAAMLAVMMRQN